jgi:NCAIR mutase (PurE)-related protein
MNIDALQELLDAVAAGETPVTSAVNKLKHLAFEDLEYAHIDHHRSIRKGFPEVIFGEGKSSDHINGILHRMTLQENVILVTRVDPEKASDVVNRFPNAVYHQDARMLILQDTDVPISGRGTILIITAGTSDIPVAKEAYLTASAMGNKVESIFDVGVAGLHRLLNYRHLIDEATVIIVVAGMEGALPSVVAGLVDCPVIAVPTSVGYGVSLGGLTALFGMLNSCSSNVAVVNIDNGFGAGYMASTINRK